MFIRFLALPLIGLLFLLPIGWLVARSLQSPDRAAPPALSNYLEAVNRYPILQPMLNSAVVGLSAVVITLITASLAGFALVLLRSPSRLLLLTLILVIVPVPAIWLPRFLMFQALGLIDSLAALIAPALMGSSPFFVLLFYWTFRRLPSALFEAARLDGATPLQIWRLIALPLARPTLAVVSVLTFTLYWNDYISPLLYLRSIPRYTIALRLRLFQNADASSLPLMMAAVVTGTLPVVLLFLVVQRYFWPEGRPTLE